MISILFMLHANLGVMWEWEKVQFQYNIYKKKWHTFMKIKLGGEWEGHMI